MEFMIQKYSTDKVTIAVSIFAREEVKDALANSSVKGRHTGMDSVGGKQCYSYVLTSEKAKAVFEKFVF